MILFAGPYAWVKYTPGEPILPNNPNEGSVKRRNEKKRMRLRREFILVRCFAKKNSLKSFFILYVLVELHLMYHLGYVSIAN